MFAAPPANPSGDPDRGLLPPLGQVQDPTATSQAASEAKPIVLTIFEARDLIRDFLASWLAMVCPEFETIAIADIDREGSQEAITRSAAVILGLADRPITEPVLARKIAVVKGIGKAVPIAVIGDPDMEVAAQLLQKFDLQGYIPTTTTSEVAAAALRLILAGGRYIPYFLDQNLATVPALPPNPGLPYITPAAEEALTLREQTVLRCLRRGLPNKLIAHELGISIGTVKLHVHNVILKLKVHNRTEAALAHGAGGGTGR